MKKILKFDDLTGLTFGRLTVHWPAGKAKVGNGGAVYWLCSCSCGNLVTVAGYSLKRKKESTVSCGCFSAERASKGNRTHGKYRTPEYSMLHSARRRAKVLKLPCNISVHDISIPEKCPLLDIPLEFHVGKPGASSPSLDRIIPKLGYVKGNIRVISWRANRIKGDSSLEEFLRIADNWKRL